MDYEVWLDKNRESLSDYIYAKMYKNICLKEGDGEMENEITNGVDWFGGSTTMTLSVSAKENIRVERVLFNGRTTICFWSDGFKSVLTRDVLDVHDEEKALAMAIAQRLLSDNKKTAQRKFSGLLKKARRINVE